MHYQVSVKHIINFTYSPINNTTLSSLISISILHPCATLSVSGNCPLETNKVLEFKF